MKNKVWVKKQFEILNKNLTNGYRLYRDTLLITSFIEAVLWKKTLKITDKYGPDFKESLKRLGVIFQNKSDNIIGYKRGCKYRANCLKEINNLRVKRNKLLHEIIKEDLTEIDIKEKIHEMSKNLEVVCINSNLIRGYFMNNYGFDPKEIIRRVEGRASAHAGHN